MVFSTGQKSCSKFFFSCFPHSCAENSSFSAHLRKTENLKKHSVIFIWQIGWSQGFSTINFHFHGVISFKKLRNFWQIYSLDFVSGAKLSFDSHFPNLKTPGKRKIVVSKPYWCNVIFKLTCFWNLRMEVLYSYETVMFSYSTVAKSLAKDCLRFFRLSL